jgi:hypothetical protein
MKKITESQLKDKVNSLREYLKVYENQQVDEWSLLSPSSWFNGRDYGDSTSRDEVRTQDATKASTGGANLALVQNREQLAPGSVASEQGKDGVTYAVDAKGMRTFKIENNKWVAMNPPTPTEQPELAGVPDAPAAAPSTQDLTAAASASGEAVGKSLQQFKELLAKAMGAAQPASAAPNSGSSYTGSVGNATNNPTPAQSPYALSANGARLNANESVNHFLNKLRLIESRQLHEALTAEEEKQLDTLAQSYGDSEDPEIAGLMKQYSDYKNSKQKATPAAPAQAAPAQAASVTPAATAAPETPAGPINRDSMTFGQAFADARKKGEKQFNWRGKPYAVKMAPPKPKTAPKEAPAQGASVTPNNTTSNYTGQDQKSTAQVDPFADDRKNAGRPGYDEAGNPVTPRSKVTAESVGYNELQRIVSLVNHR